MFCTNCGQLQLSHVVSPEILFRHYVWVSSTSSVTVAHFEEYARTVLRSCRFRKGDLVIDIGSNDGTLLKSFKKRGAKVLGIDPARNIARLATRQGIRTIPQFFNLSLAKQIRRTYGAAMVITANNCFAHIHDLDEVMGGVGELLAKDGIFIIEAPYNIDLIEKNLFDIIYHEHLSYLSVTPLDKFFKRFGMKIYDVIKQQVHGGSIRVCVGTGRLVRPSVRKFIDAEYTKKLHDINTYRKLAKRIKKNKAVLSKLLRKLKNENMAIAGYGASAKSTTLLHYFGIGRETLDFIADDNALKIGLFTPGKHIPIAAPKELYTRKPDYLLLLAWNFSDSIMRMHKKYKFLGGRFIIPVPTPKIL